MLTEIAITPQVFDPTANLGGSWRENLRELGRLLSPYMGNACPMLVADLQNGGWLAATAERVKQIEDHRSRTLAENILQRVAEIRVRWPSWREPANSEQDWIGEAMRCHHAQPLETIITTKSAAAETSVAADSLESLEDACKPGRWEDVQVNRLVALNLADQMCLLRPLCLHAGFLSFVSPYLFGIEDDETGFAVELIRLAEGRPEGFPSLSIDIHTKADEGSPEQALSNRVSNLQARLVAARRNARIRLFFWSDALERVLLAGNASGEHFGARWGVSMTHVARRRDQDHRDMATWSLLARKARSYWFARLYGTDTEGRLLRAPITV